MENFETYEYVITPKADSKRTLKKLLFIALYVVFVIAWLIFGVVTGLATLLALIPVTLWMLIFATWRYVNIEYEYSVASGVITFSKIYGGRSRKTVYTLDVRQIEELLPLGHHFTERRLDDFDPQIEVSFLSSSESEQAYVALYADENGDKCAVYLEVLPMLMKSLKLYNSAVVKKLESSEVKN